MPDDTQDSWKPLADLRPGTVFRALNGGLYAKTGISRRNDDSILCLDLQDGMHWSEECEALCWPLVLGGFTQATEESDG